MEKLCYPLKTLKDFLHLILVLVRKVGPVCIILQDVEEKSIKSSILINALLKIYA